MSEPKPEMWAIVELMGHVRLAKASLPSPANTDDDVDYDSEEDDSTPGF